MPFAIRKTVKTREKTKTTTTGATGGINLRDYPQLLDASRAQKIENYTVERDGRLTKRKGLKKMLEVAGDNPITTITKLTDTLYLYSYATTLAAYNKNNASSTVIKNDFTNPLTDGIRYGQTIYTCNGTDGEAIYGTGLPTLAYDGQTSNFVVGEVVTGTTSGATATIIADADSGATGVLTLDNITGTFQNNEPITSSTGEAVVDGTLTWTTGAVANAPKCYTLFIFDQRLLAGRTNTDETEVQASKQNDFTTWTAGANAGDPFNVLWKQAGKVNTIASLDNSGVEQNGNVCVIFYDDGYYGFYVETLDVGGVLSQNISELFTRKEHGAYKSLSTAKGIYYANSSGVFLRRHGQSGEMDDENLTYDLGNDRINELNFEDADMVFLPERDLLLVTCGDDSTTNNYVLWLNTNTVGTQTKAWGEFTGWAISRFLYDEGSLYGTSSLNTKIYSCFTTNTDDGSNISTHYRQELNTGALETIKDLEHIFVGGYLTEDKNINLGFDVYTEKGLLNTDKLEYAWSAQSSAVLPGGIGITDFGETMGAEFPESGTVWSPAQIRYRIYGFLRLILTIDETSDAPHQINYISIKTAQIREHRKNLLTINS